MAAPLTTSRAYHARHLEAAAEARRRAAHGFLELKRGRIEAARNAIMAAAGERSLWGSRAKWPLTYRLP